MKTHEFIEWLKTQDQDATIEVLKRCDGDAYHKDYVATVKFNPEEHSYYTDMRDNQFAKGESYENNRTLLLGEE